MEKPLMCSLKDRRSGIAQTTVCSSVRSCSVPSAPLSGFVMVGYDPGEQGGRGGTQAVPGQNSPYEAVAGGPKRTSIGWQREARPGGDLKIDWLIPEGEYGRFCQNLINLLCGQDLRIIRQKTLSQW